MSWAFRGPLRPQNRICLQGLFTPPRFSILDSFAFEDAPFPQNMPGPSLSAPSSPWLTGETFPTLYETMPPSQDGAINYDPSHKGVTGVELRVTGDQHLSTVVHAIPPVSSTQCVSSKENLTWEQHSWFHLYRRPQPSHLVGSRYLRGIMIMDADKEVSDR